jgi:adenosine deaminase/adenosine deaminase CECR1
MSIIVSISFIKEAKVKQQLLNDLDQRFAKFEANFPLK